MLLFVQKKNETRCIRRVSNNGGEVRFNVRKQWMAEGGTGREEKEEKKTHTHTGKQEGMKISICWNAITNVDEMRTTNWTLPRQWLYSDRKKKRRMNERNKTAGKRARRPVFFSSSSLYWLTHQNQYYGIVLLNWLEDYFDRLKVIYV